MESSIEKIFSKMELLYENIFNLMIGIQKASNTSDKTITVNLKNEDGTVENISINSFQQLQSELTRLDNNYKSLINSDNIGYTLNADGSLSQVTKTTFINAEYLENFVIPTDLTCKIDRKSIINDLVFPNVKLPITISSKIRSDVYCRCFEISDGWENIPENPTLINLEYLSDQGKISYSQVDKTLQLEKNQIKYFGKFTIVSVTPSTINTNEFTINISDIKYQGLYQNGKSFDLKLNDILVSSTGASKYQITSIDKTTKTLVVIRIAGSEILSVGTDKLFFNEQLTSDEFIVGVPVKPTQKMVVFLSTENFKNISYPSAGIKLDTSTYKVISNGTEFTLDDYFSNYVTNFSDYLLSFVDESSIPVSLGITPDKPILLDTNFKVKQINKHLSDSKSTTEIKELNTKKESVQNDINYTQGLIDTILNEINTQTFKTVEEKNYKLDQITQYRSQIVTLKSNLLKISQDIDADATKYGLKNITPKYGVIGFWPIKCPISTSTGKQSIVKYEVLYRYLSKNVDTVESTSYSMYDEDGNTVTVAFSPWNVLTTTSLNKVKNDDGKYIWEIQTNDSVEEININQCLIPINEGEAVEIKVRAISEAGYPLAPVKSEWSDILRIDFPSDLSTNNLSTVINKNTVDLAKAEFDSILTSYGLINHISGQITESEKTFLHSAKDITSGQYTSEQKNIALDVALANIIARITALENSDLTKSLDIAIIDFNSETFTVSNNTTMQLNAGNYTDTVGLLDNTKWGSIIRKQAYIKIKNNNNLPVELKTLVPGITFNSSTAPTYYNVPVKNDNGYLQSSKQVIYFRNIDLTGQPGNNFKLVCEKLLATKTYPVSVDLDSTAVDINKNMLYYKDSLVTKGKLKSIYSTDFVGFTTEHPLYDYNNTEAMVAEFARIAKYTENIKTSQYQTENSDVLGFADNDFYAIGQSTCGAFLYPVISNISSICVVGDSTTSTLIISANSEILIPIVFEYRMIDRFGNINGLLNQDSNTTLIYDKKLGIDILLPDNSLFKFDINVSCKLKSQITTADSLSLSSVVASYTGEGTASLT